MLSDPVSYWEKRHQDFDLWRSGGDRGLSVEENYEFYLWRLGKIIEILRTYHSGFRPLQILDAGCGRGFFSNELRRCGHDVRGIDASPTAIASATNNFGSGFCVCELHRYRSSRLFDAIICIDVLFHILDDDIWLATLQNFVSSLHSRGILILSDVLAEQSFVLGDYIIHRSKELYAAKLNEMGYCLFDYIPYNFGSNPNGFAIYGLNH